MIFLKQSTASQEVALGPFVDSVDGVTAETALTINNTDIKIHKAGATTLANKNSGGATHISGGIYYAVLDATDTDTVGSGQIHVSVSGALPVKLDFCVLTATIYDALVAGTGNLTTLISAGTGTGQLDISSGKLAWNTAWDAEVQSEVDDALVAQRLDHLVATSVTGTDVADDSIIAKLVSSAATADWDTYVNTTDALQAIRDRGDAAWTTGGGGSITDIVQWEPIIPYVIDLANTKTYRLGIALTNMLDDLPTTVEITPGTISIERAAQGGTSWTAVRTDAACSEIAGLIYYDETFNTANGYSAGDVLRITFKSQTVTVSANDYEITGSTGRMFYTGIIADTPNVNVTKISGSTTAADVLELFALALDQGTGQLDNGSFAADAITATAIQDGAFTNSKFAGNVPSDVIAISGDTAAADNAEAFFDGTGYAGTNNVIPSVTTVTGNVNGSVGSVTGAVGSVTGAVGSVTGAVGSVTGNVGGNVVGSVGSLAAQAKADVNAEVLDVLATDTFAEPNAVPAATSSLKDKLNWLFALARNKITQNSTTQTLRNDGDAGNIATRTVSDDGTTYTQNKWS